MKKYAIGKNYAVVVQLPDIRIGRSMTEIEQSELVTQNDFVSKRLCYFDGRYWFED